jgi:hypothetical protein
LTGTIGERGGLTLTGNLGKGKVCVQGKLVGNELAATYQTEESIPEKGSFKIAFKGVRRKIQQTTNSRLFSSANGSLTFTNPVNAFQTSVPI